MFRTKDLKKLSTIAVRLYPEVEIRRTGKGHLKYVDTNTGQVIHVTSTDGDHYAERQLEQAFKRAGKPLR